MQELLTAEEVEARLDVIPAHGPEYKALRFLQHAYYLQAEGLMAIEGDRCFAAEA